MSENDYLKFEESSANMPTEKKARTGLIVGIVVAVIIAAIVIGAITITNAKQKIELEKYYKDYESASIMMIQGAADAENLGNTIKSVWYNAIYNKYDANTDKYTLRDGKFFDDFNDALGNLFSDSEYEEKVSDLKTNQENAKNIMKQLMNPPEEYKDAFDSLNTFYEKYLSLTDMVINPTGSLNIFSENFNTADTEACNAYKKVELYLR